MIAGLCRSPRMRYISRDIYRLRLLTFVIIKCKYSFRLYYTLSLLCTYFNTTCAATFTSVLWRRKGRLSKYLLVCRIIMALPFGNGVLGRAGESEQRTRIISATVRTRQAVKCTMFLARSSGIVIGRCTSAAPYRRARNKKAVVQDPSHRRVTSEK